MKRRILLYVALFTVFVCSIFVAYNPNIATDYTNDFNEGEVITSENSHFDFGAFSLNCTGAKNFTTRVISSGHTQFIDDDANITINLIEFDKLIPSKRDEINYFLNGELNKPSWSVDGVSVHEIRFMFSDELYPAYQKNSTTNTVVYLSTPNEKETADMMNSLIFKDE